MKITLKQAQHLIRAAAGFACDDGVARVTEIDGTDVSDEFLRVTWDSGGSFGDVSAAFHRSDNAYVDLIDSSLFLKEPDGEEFQLSLLQPMYDARQVLTDALIAADEVPESLTFWSADEVAECLSGIGDTAYHELWAAVAESERAGTDKPSGGDGSDGTFEEPVITNGEYGTDLVAVWPKLTAESKAAIIKAALAASSNS